MNRPAGRSAARRWLAPEVVQSSAMDCGPAALKCLLEGFGIAVGLRPLARGLPDRARRHLDRHPRRDWPETLGLDAEQVSAAGGPPLPAGRRERCRPWWWWPDAQGVTHFVVVWRRWGTLAAGDGSGQRPPLDHARRLSPPSSTGTACGCRPRPGGGGPARMRRGRPSRRAWMRSRCRASRPRELLERAAADPSWRAFATLDAALRLGAVLVAAGALRRGRRGRPPWSDRCAADPAEPMLARYFMVEPAADDGPTPDRRELWLLGAVLLRVSGRRGRAERPAAAAGAAASASWRRSLAEPERGPGRRLLDLGARRRRLRGRHLVAAGLAAASLAVVAEALLFRGLLDLGVRLVLPEQRLAGRPAGRLAGRPGGARGRVDRRHHAARPAARDRAAARPAGQDSAAWRSAISRAGSARTWPNAATACTSCGWDPSWWPTPCAASSSWS